VEKNRLDRENTSGPERAKPGEVQSYNEKPAKGKVETRQAATQKRKQANMLKGKKKVGSQTKKSGKKKRPLQRH